jgi:hypothetical protein
METNDLVRLGVRVGEVIGAEVGYMDRDMVGYVDDRNVNGAPVGVCVVGASVGDAVNEIPVGDSVVGTSVSDAVDAT